jgi:hypothetical protein
MVSIFSVEIVDYKLGFSGELVYVRCGAFFEKTAPHPEKT